MAKKNNSKANKAQLKTPKPKATAEGLENDTIFRPRLNTPAPKIIQLKTAYKRKPKHPSKNEEEKAWVYKFFLRYFNYINSIYI